MHTRQQISGDKTEVGKIDREGENRSTATSSGDFRSTHQNNQTNETNQG